MTKKTEFIEKILKERERQLNLFGSEYDLNKLPNDWVALVTRYVSEAGQYNFVLPQQDDFEHSIIVAAAICLAAYENIDNMVQKKCLKTVTECLTVETMENIISTVNNSNFIETIQKIHEDVDDDRSKSNC